MAAVFGRALAVLTRGHEIAVVVIPLVAEAIVAGMLEDIEELRGAELPPARASE